MWTVYILECANGRLYTGITNDMKRRLETHVAGKGGRFTRAFRPKKIVYREQAQDRSQALQREAAIKKLSRKEKFILIKS